ncbi:MAG: FtsX-like permease family protein [Saprospiraceae bacterium]|nr:FtsX-like permease family protein [bacterium]MDG1434390.1 FtsX-like permease family protein [Saprospiraceae bacterium]MDG2419463.1 FtsX-like permease family protein [Saprospiraceae bacterium]
MIQFLLKGILRDKSRSILPIIVVSIGVALTVVLSAYMNGAFGDMIDQNARFETGHVKIMTKAYAKNIAQLPNDLALLEVDELTKSLEKDYPEMQWVNRIRFGGLIDVPDGQGESKGQGPAAGMAINLFDEKSGEAKRMNIEKSLVKGMMPKKNGEAIIGDDFAKKLNVNIGDEVTYFGTTMNGSMTFQNFVVSGTIRFGAAAIDRGVIMVDISDAQRMLDMENGTGELLGFSKLNIYEDEKVEFLASNFNEKYADDKDEFTPIMMPLRAQNNLGEIIDYSNYMSGIFIFIFVFAMSIVLWNTGLLGGLRRYQEFGIRLALGEAKGTIYRRLIMEAILIGMIGSIVGTLIGLAGAYYLQIVGIDISGYMDNSTMLMPSVLRAKVTFELFFIGFIPGLLAMVFGNMLSGIGIYKRETAQLFKELEV